MKAIQTKVQKMKAIQTNSDSSGFQTGACIENDNNSPHELASYVSPCINRRLSTYIREEYYSLLEFQVQINPETNHLMTTLDAHLSGMLHSLENVAQHIGIDLLAELEEGI